ncbi:MAG TPA: aldehyde dehydrogenase family protein, partial [Baekduia sp.]|nr:aldehyde dehydrogenase family protein [Baekduia sp.]
MTEGLPPFTNEPVAELRRAAERERLQAALAELDRRLPLRAPSVVDGRPLDGAELVSTDPAAPDRVVALATRATPDDARAAVQAAGRAFGAWAATPAADRAAALRRAAAWVRDRRGELAALCVRECAKPWAEADADVCEAIDFLEFYARGALALDRGHALFQVPGERNALRYAPRGVTAVIA